MPKLPTRSADLGGSVISGGRQATATDFGAVDLTGAVRAVQRVGNEIIQTKEEDESRKVLVSQAEIRAKYAKRLDEAATSGEDVGKIRQELDNDLANVTANLETRKGAETAALHAANTGSIFDNQANQIAVQRATLTARVEGGKFLNSTGAILATNPGYLPQAEQDVDAFVATLSKVSPEQRAVIANDLKQNLNVAAAMAQARIDPEGIKTALEGGQFNMTPQQRSQVIHQAETTIRAKRADERLARAEEKEKRRELSDQARDEYFKNIVKGKTDLTAMVNDPRLDVTDREHLIVFAEARAKAGAAAERRSNQTVKNNLWLQISNGEIRNNQPIIDAVNRGDLNIQDADYLNAKVANQKDENNRNFSQRLGARMQTVIGAMRSSPEYQAQPELAAAIQLQMAADVERRSSELRKQNTSPDVLLDPDSKDYYFTPSRIKQVASDVKQQMQDTLSPATRVTSQADYDALPDGTPYIDSNGTRGVKRGAAKKPAEPATKPMGFDVTKGGLTLPGSR